MALMQTYVSDVQKAATDLLASIQQIYVDIYDFSALSQLLKQTEQLTYYLQADLAKYSESQLLSAVFTLSDVLTTVGALVSAKDLQGSPHLLPLLASALSRVVFATVSANVDAVVKSTVYLSDYCFYLMLRLFLQSAFNMDTKRSEDVSYGLQAQNTTGDQQKRSEHLFQRYLVGGAKFRASFISFFELSDEMERNQYLNYAFYFPEWELDISQATALKSVVTFAIRDGINEQAFLRHCRVSVFDGKICLPDISCNFGTLKDIFSFLKSLEQHTSTLALKGAADVADPRANKQDKYMEYLVAYLPSDFPIIQLWILSVPVLARMTQSEAQALLGRPVFPQNYFCASGNQLFDYILSVYNNSDEDTQEQRELTASHAQIMNKRINMPIPASAALKTANAAPFVVSRYIYREAARALQNYIKSMGHSQAAKLAKFIGTHYLNYVDRVAQIVRSYAHNTAPPDMNDKQLIQELFYSAEIENFTDIFTLKDRQDVAYFILQAVQAYVGITVNAAFMTVSRREIAISGFSGIIYPLGGFSSVLVLFYLNQLISDFKLFEIAQFAFKYAQNAVLDLINAKDGAGHSIVEYICQYRGIVLKDYQRLWYCGKKAYRSFCLQLFNYSDIQSDPKQLREFLGYMNRDVIEQSYNYLLIFDCIPRITAGAFALAELFNFSPSAKLSSLVYGLQLSPTLLYILQYAHGDQLSQLYVAVVSADSAGGTTLLGYLLYLPSKRYATIQETLLLDYNQYKYQLLIENSSHPWHFLNSHNIPLGQSRKAFYIVQADDDVVSVGSWLSMDSQSLYTKLYQENEYNEAAVHVLSYFLLKLKNVELTDKTDYLRQEKLNYQPVTAPEFEYKAERSYADIMHAIPGQLFYNVEPDAQTSYFRGATVYVQRDRKQIPPLVFVDYKPPRTEFAVARYMNLLPFQGSVGLTVLDIPLRMTGFGRSDVVEQEKLRLYYLIAEQRSYLEQAQAQIVQNQTVFSGVYYQLLVIFQKPKLPQAFLYPQAKLFQVIINQAKQLQRTVANYFQYLVKYQQLACYQEADKASQTIQMYKSQYQALQLSNQVTPELEQRCQLSIQYFEKQIEMQNQIAKYINAEEQLVAKLLAAYDELTTYAYRNQIAQYKIQILYTLLSKLAVNEQTYSTYYQLIQQAAVTVLVYDCTGGASQCFSSELCDFLASTYKGVIFVCNKIDLFERYGCLATIQHNCAAAARYGFSHYFVGGESCQFVCSLRAYIVRKLCQQYKIDIENEIQLYKK